MEERSKLLCELLSENTTEDLRKLVNYKRQFKKPKSIVNNMLDYFKHSPIPPAPQANMTEVRRAMTNNNKQQQQQQQQILLKYN